MAKGFRWPETVASNYDNDLWPYRERDLRPFTWLQRHFDPASPPPLQQARARRLIKARVAETLNLPCHVVFKEIADLAPTGRGNGAWQNRPRTTLSYNDSMNVALNRALLPTFNAWGPPASRRSGQWAAAYERGFEMIFDRFYTHGNNNLYVRTASKQRTDFMVQGSTWAWVRAADMAARAWSRRRHWPFCVPFLDWLEAGVGAFRAYPDSRRGIVVEACGLPVIRISRERVLHAPLGTPAVDGGPPRLRYYLFRGIAVPDKRPRTARGILRVGNMEARRVLIEEYGIDRWLKNIDARALQEDEYGQLFDVDGTRWVRLENSTPEADGTRRVFILGAQGASTAKQAVARSFGLDEEDYDEVAAS